MDEKEKLRTEMRRRRRDHVAALPDSTRALLFLRPPGAIAALAPKGATVGIYHPLPAEAPTQSYATWFFENGRQVALPWFESRESPMRFKEWSDPLGSNDLEVGPFGQLQPSADSNDLQPSLAFVPLLAFSAAGGRLGQGGGHYDRWLAENPATVAVGLAWDCQLAESLPLKDHDQTLHAVITPTRLYGEDI